MAGHRPDQQRSPLRRPRSIRPPPRRPPRTPSLPRPRSRLRRRQRTLQTSAFLVGARHVYPEPRRAVPAAPRYSRSRLFRFRLPRPFLPPDPPNNPDPESLLFLAQHARLIRKKRRLIRKIPPPLIPHQKSTGKFVIEAHSGFLQ